MEETQDLHDAGSEDVEVRCHARTSAGRVPAERCLHTCTLLVQNGSRVVYLYAGRGKSGALDDLHQLDLEGNVWTQPKVTGPIPIPIRIAIARPRPRPCPNYHANHDPYLTLTLTLTKVTSEKPAGRFGHSGVAHGESIYYFGGQSRGQATFNFEQGAAPSSIFSDQKRGKRESDTEAVDQLLVFNTSTTGWSEPQAEGTPPCARYEHGACLIPEP